MSFKSREVGGEELRREGRTWGKGPKTLKLRKENRERKQGLVEDAAFEAFSVQINHFLL